MAHIKYSKTYLSHEPLHIIGGNKNMNIRKEKNNINRCTYIYDIETLVNENEKLPQIDCADSATAYNI